MELRKLATVYIDKLPNLPPGEIHVLSADEKFLYRAVWRVDRQHNLSRYEVEVSSTIGPTTWRHITWADNADAAMTTLLRLCEEQGR